MTCRGYDAKAVKVPKSVKRAAALIHDAHQRGAFVRSFVDILLSEGRGRGSRKSYQKAS
jgi:hypothetical protein